MSIEQQDGGVRISQIGEEDLHLGTVEQSLIELLLSNVYTPARRTATMPLRKMPSKVPAPPMLAMGAPSFLIALRFDKSAPISVPRTPAT